MPVRHLLGHDSVDWIETFLLSKPLEWRTFYIDNLNSPVQAPQVSIGIQNVMVMLLGRT